VAVTIGVKPHFVGRRTKWGLTSCVVALLLSMGSAQAERQWLPLPAGEITRIAFGSCAKQWQAQPIWDAVIAREPDLFLFLGDAIYGDTDGTTAWDVTPEQLAGEWNRLADKPEVARLMASVPVMATWDNHDYGTHNGGTDFSIKHESREIFLDFFDEPDDSVRRQHDGIYTAKIFGPAGRRVQIILLDTRFFKGPAERDARSAEEKAQFNIVGTYAPNYAAGVTLLGAAQWAWLAEQLAQPAELRLIASGIQIIPDEKGMDEWGNYPRERHRLIDFLRDANTNGVVLLSGNVHFGEVSGIVDLDYPLLELTSSGLTHINERYAQMKNSYRVAGPVVEVNFGMVEVNWHAEGGPQVTLSLNTLDRARPFSYSFALQSIQ
jgi:alkaline phosphatase D